MKRMNLWTKLFFQAFVALMIPVYYYIAVTYGFQIFPHYLFFFIAVLGLFAEDRRLRKSADAMDECAQKALRIADAVCFKGSLFLMGVAAVPLPLPENPEIAVSMAGYALSSGIFVLFLIRAFIFLWHGKPG